MELNDEVILHLNEQLTSLNITMRISKEELQAKHASLKIIQTCQDLIQKLYSPAYPTVNSLDEVYDALNSSPNNRPYFPKNCEYFSYCLISFLCSCFQGKLVNNFRNNMENRRENAGYQSRLLFTLDKICRDLKISIPSDNAEIPMILDTIVNTIVTKKEAVPSLDLLLDNPPTILPQSSNLSTPQTKLINQIHQGIVEVNDAFHVPISLLAEHSERVTETFSGLFAKSLVKSVIIGAVPDRGGRTTSIRTKISSAEQGGRGGKEQKFKEGHKTSSTNTITAATSTVDIPMEISTAESITADNTSVSATNSVTVSDPKLDIGVVAEGVEKQGGDVDDSTPSPSSSRGIKRENGPTRKNHDKKFKKKHH